MAFPVVRSLVVHRSNWYSRAGTVSLPVGTLYSSEYPLTNLIDGLAGPMTRFGNKTIRVRVTLPSEQNVNIIGICNHNLDPALLIQPYVDGVPLSRSFGVTYPNCWIDVRGFNSLTATGLPLTTVDLSISGNSQFIAMGELVVAGGYIFDGTIEAPIQPTVTGKAVRRYTASGKLFESGYGTITRQMRLSLQVDRLGAEATYLQAIFDDVAEAGVLVPVVPTTNINDFWLARWPKRREFMHDNQRIVKVPLDLTEEAGGVLV